MVANGGASFRGGGFNRGKIWPPEIRSSAKKECVGMGEEQR